MDDLIQDFVAETQEMLAALGEEIVAWEAAPHDRSRLDAIFRFVHTVKGNCGFFDLPRLKALSHAAEDALCEVRTGRREADAALVSAVLAIIDRIAEIVEALAAGTVHESDDDHALIDGLTRRGEPAAAPHAGDPKRALRSVRISVDLLDRVMSGVSDMVLARNELARRLRDAPADPGVEAAFTRLSASIVEMREAITRTRMQRIDSLFGPLPRLVRDLAAELEKNVRLEIDGADVELDREMIEMVRDPLTHIVRNAIDHGIEIPAERLAAGKPAQGSLLVSARQSGNRILIEICDDGRGLDADRIAAQAVESGLVAAEQAAAMTADQKCDLIFAAGLSTAETVTSISGRGVGMDVVRDNLERVGGGVDLENRPGHGLRITLRVPLTLTIIPALTVTSLGRSYAIPRSAVEEIVRIKSGVDIDLVGGAPVARIRDRRMPVVGLDGVFGGDVARARCGCLVVLKPAGGEPYALGVEAVHDHVELVVKPASPAVAAARIYAGTTLAEDGSPMLILDATGIAEVAGVGHGAGHAQPSAEQSSETPAEEGEQALLFRALDGAKRAIPVASIERIDEIAAGAVRHSGGRMRAAVGDSILSLVGVEDNPASGRLRLLRVAPASDRVAYAFAEVIDLVTLPANRVPASAGSIAGVALIDGELVEILDPRALIAAASELDVDQPAAARRAAG